MTDLPPRTDWTPSPPKPGTPEVPRVPEPAPVDMVNHPPHYARLKPEPIDVIEAWQLDYFRGNALKYIARAGHKDDEVQDLEKAVWYLQRRIKQLGG